MAHKSKGKPAADFICKLHKFGHGLGALVSLRCWECRVQKERGGAAEGGGIKAAVQP